MAAKKKKVAKKATKKVTKKATKKKATKKKAKKRTKKAAAKDDAPKRALTAGVKSPRDTRTSARFSDGMKSATVELNKQPTGSWRATQAAAEFRRRLLFTGLVEMDMNIRMAIGTRTQIIGPEHVGKSLMCYLLAGSFQRTCRRCMTPILTFHDDLGERDNVIRCGCGANDVSTVLFIDVEGDFDPLWAQSWGFKIADRVDMSDPMAEYEEVEEGLLISPDSTVAVARITSLNQVEILSSHLIKNGAADLIILDSVAMAAIDEDLAGRKQTASRARELSRLYPKLISAQNEAWNQSGVMPTFIQTNQWRANIQSGPGGYGGPSKIASGGNALKYALMQNMEIRTRYNPWDGGYREPAAMAEMTMTMKKDKASGGGTNASAQARLFLKDRLFDRVHYEAGETDEGARVFELLKALSEGAWELPPDDRWFKKTSRGYEILGRTFTKIADIKAFLSRPDIGYRLRYPLAAAIMPRTFRGHLDAEAHLYGPFDDPLQDLIHEAHDRLKGHQPAAGAAEDSEEAEGGDPLDALEAGLEQEDG